MRHEEGSKAEMRILMLSHGYPPVISGVTLIVQKLAKAMVAKGHDVAVVAGSDRKESYEADDQGVDLVRVRSLRNPFWQRGPIPFMSQSELDELLDRFQPDLIHDHDAGPLGAQLARLSEELTIPLMATCHFVPRFVAGYLTWDRQPHEAIESVIWAYSLWLYDHFGHLVFPNETHRRAFTQQGLTVPTSIISNGLDITRYRPDRGAEDDDLAARYGLPAGPRVLFVGRLMRDKEIEVLIQAIAAMRLRVKAHLIIAGQGDDRQRLEGITEEMGLQSQVHFLGFVPEADMPALYRAVDCFAIASQCEVQSLPTLQALATGLPVVVADAMALPELVRHGINGFLVEPENAHDLGVALTRVLTEPDLAARMGRESLALAQPHDETRTFDQYDALYRRLASRPRQGAASPARSA